MSEVFGKPVEGQVQHYSSEPVEQAHPNVLRDALDSLFELPNVKSVRWEQYTPYFNDGDACEFNIYDAKILVSGAAEDAGDYEDGYMDTYDFKYRADTLGDIDNLEELTRRFSLVSAEIAGGQHFIFLKQSFGDPAQVTATREGFSIEFYDHD